MDLGNLNLDILDLVLLQLQTHEYNLQTLIFKISDLNNQDLDKNLDKLDLVFLLLQTHELNLQTHNFNL